MKTMKNEIHLNTPPNPARQMGIQMPESSATSNLNGPCFAKILLTNNLAGSIIGKNGKIISSIESRSSCNLRLSSADNYFPGTMQRICLISGEPEGVKTAYSLILNKIKDTHSPNQSQKDEGINQSSEHNLNENAPTFSDNPNLSNDNSERFSITIVIPRTSVSAIIGRGGESIKALTQNTGTKIVISDKENGIPERMVSIYGHYKSLITAGSSIIDTIQADPQIRNSLLLLDYRSINSTPPSQMLSNNRPIYKQYNSNIGHDEHSTYPGISLNVMLSHCEITFEIPDNAIDAILGKHGNALTEIIMKMGAKLTVYQKGKPGRGINQRSVSLSGNLSSVHHAHAFLTQQYFNYLELQESMSNSKPYSGSKILPNKPSINHTGSHFTH